MTFSPVQERPLHGGEQKVYRFDNGYGASVVRHAYSYGGPSLWELGVTSLGPGGVDDWSLCYDTPITADVIGYLSWEEVEEKLAEIAALPGDPNSHPRGDE